MVDWGNHPFLLAVWRSRYTTSAVQLTRRSSSQNGQSIPRGAPLFITFERSTKNSSTILHIYPNDTAGHEIVHHLLPQKKMIVSSTIHQSPVDQGKAHPAEPRRAAAYNDEFATSGVPFLKSRLLRWKSTASKTHHVVAQLMAWTSNGPQNEQIVNTH